MATTTVKPDGTVIVDTGEHAAKATWDGKGVAGVVVKSAPERRFTLTLAYPANKADVSVAADGHRDFASAEAVEDAAHAFMKSPSIGLWHQDGTDGAGTVVESYIWPADDWTVKAADGTEQTIRKGDWLLGIVWSEDTWPLVKEGHIGGVSMQGAARRRQASPEALAALRS
jgi:hypothetical protein